MGFDFAAIRRNLVEDSRQGGMTLFLGAGVSIGSGVPSWGALVEAIWRTAPRKRKAVAFDAFTPASHPLALQILLEEIAESLRPSSKGEVDPVRAGDAQLVELLRTALYQSVRSDSDGSLAQIVGALRIDQARWPQRIRRVITMNADDLLEVRANEGHAAEKPVVWPISRASYHPRRDPCAHGMPPVSVYHIHGYLPHVAGARGRGAREASDTLVFTDAQYWESVASPTSFANRVVHNALHDSHCIFVGLSMTDVNLMRWLGTRFVEIEADKRSQVGLEGKAPRTAERAIRKALRRHYWVRTDSADPTGLVSRHVERRGVLPVAIADWGATFQALMADCFH